jgi:hypothetical protein
MNNTLDVISVDAIATCLKAICTTTQIARIFSETPITKQRRLSHIKTTDATISILDEELEQGLLANQLPFAKTVYHYKQNYEHFIIAIKTDLSHPERTKLYRNKAVFQPNPASATQQDKRLDELYFAVLNIDRTMEKDVPDEFKTADIESYEKQLESHWSPAYFDTHANLIHQQLNEIRQLQKECDISVVIQPPAKRHKRKQLNPKRRVIKHKSVCLLDDINVLVDSATQSATKAPNLDAKYVVTVELITINKMVDAMLALYPSRQNRLMAVLDGWDVKESNDKVAIISRSRPRQQYTCTRNGSMHGDCILCKVLLNARTSGVLFLSDLKRIQHRLNTASDSMA